MAQRNRIYLQTQRTVKALKVEAEKPKDKRYAMNQWKNYTKRFRSTHPECAMCKRLFPAGELQCDHVIPVHLGGAFWSSVNHQALCRQCHAVKTRKEAGGQAMHEWKLNDNNEKIPAWTS